MVARLSGWAAGIAAIAWLVTGAVRALTRIVRLDLNRVTRCRSDARAASPSADPPATPTSISPTGDDLQSDAARALDSDPRDRAAASSCRCRPRPTADREPRPTIRRGVPTSTRGAAASTCARWPAGSTTRSTSTGSASSGRASSTSPTRAARCSSRTTRRDPVRRAGDHARHRDGARPAGVRPRREPVPRAAGRRHAVVARRRRRRASRQRVPAAARRAAARARVPRGHARARASTTASATSSAASAAAASSRSRCARACRSSRSRSSAPRSRCRSCSRAAGSPKLLGVPYFPVTANMLAVRARSGSSRYFPAKFQLRVLPPVHFDVPPEPGALLAQPGDGRVRAHPRAWSRRRSTTCCARAAASGSAEAERACASSSPGSAPTGAAALAQALEQRPDVEVDRRPRHERPAGAARAHRVRAHRLDLLDPRPHRAGHAGRHDPAHAPHRRLDARQRPRAARDQRHRHDEPARGGGRGREPGAQGRA